MSLQTRLSALISSIGADIKSHAAQLDALSGSVQDVVNVATATLSFNPDLGPYEIIIEGVHKPGGSSTKQMTFRPGASRVSPIGNVRNGAYISSGTATPSTGDNPLASGSGIYLSNTWSSTIDTFTIIRGVFTPRPVSNRAMFGGHRLAADTGTIGNVLVNQISGAIDGNVDFTAATIDFGGGAGTFTGRIICRPLAPALASAFTPPTKEQVKYSVGPMAGSNLSVGATPTSKWVSLTGFALTFTTPDYDCQAHLDLLARFVSTNSTWYNCQVGVGITPDPTDRKWVDPVAGGGLNASQLDVMGSAYLSSTAQAGLMLESFDDLVLAANTTYTFQVFALTGAAASIIYWTSGGSNNLMTVTLDPL